MFIAALILNIVVLLPVLIWIGQDTASAERAYGRDTQARRILTCIYIAIAMASAGLLGAHMLGNPDAHSWTQALLGVQVFYKLLTWPAVGLLNPVVISNLAITAFHATAPVMS